MPKPSKPIPLPEAARLIGWSPGRLRRYVLRREREVGQKILVRVGEGTKRVRYLVSLSVLKDSDPALFHGKRDEMADKLREALAEFSRELSGMNDRIAQVEENMGALGDRVRAIISRYQSMQRAS